MQIQMLLNEKKVTADIAPDMLPLISCGARGATA